MLFPRANSSFQPSYMGSTQKVALMPDETLNGKPILAMSLKDDTFIDSVLEFSEYCKTAMGDHQMSEPGDCRESQGGSS